MTRKDMKHQKVTVYIDEQTQKALDAIVSSGAGSHSRASGSKSLTIRTLLEFAEESPLFVYREYQQVGEMGNRTFMLSPRNIAYMRSLPGVSASSLLRSIIIQYWEKLGKPIVPCQARRGRPRIHEQGKKTMRKDIYTCKRKDGEE